MISKKELLLGNDYDSLSDECKSNFDELLVKINQIRTKYNRPMTPTSSYRSFKKHCQVYVDKKIITQEEANDYIKLHEAKQPIPNAKIPCKSKHLVAAAVDIADPNGKLWQWVKDNEKILEEIGLWIEDDPSTPRVHFQITPPASKRRFFKP